MKLPVNNLSQKQSKLQYISNELHDIDITPDTTQNIWNQSLNFTVKIISDRGSK